MSEWFSANLPNILVCLALGGIVFLSIFATVRGRKKGKPSCGGNCACCGACKGCSACGCCAAAKTAQNAGSVPGK